MADPFVYYIGRKSALTASILERFPADFSCYVEPMCGSASVFFAAQAAGLLDGKSAVIADANPELVSLLVAVQQDPLSVFEAAQTYDTMLKEAKDAKATYFKLRELFNGPRRSNAGLQLVLRQVLLNSTWRVNKSGQMNVPPRPTKQLRKLNLPSLEHLEACATALAGVDIQNLNYRQFDREFEVGKGDVAYFDPPYWSESGGFVSYTAEGFTADDQTDLIKQCARWTEAGAHVIYSNADEPTVAQWLSEHWPAAEARQLTVDRNVAADPKHRGRTTELLVDALPGARAMATRRKTAKTETPDPTPVRFERMNANVKVPITAELGALNIFVGGNRKGKSAGIEAVRLAWTGKLPGLVHGKDVAEFVPDGVKHLSSELSNGSLTAAYSAEAGKKLPGASTFSPDLAARVADYEHVLPSVTLRDLLSKSAEKARESIMRRFGGLKTIPIPKALDEAQRDLWCEAIGAVAGVPSFASADALVASAVEQMPAAEILAGMQSWLDRAQRAANTEANGKERDLETARDIAFDLAGVELLPELEAQRDKARAFEQQATNRSALAAAEAQMADVEPQAHAIIAEQAAAESDLARLQGERDAATASSEQVLAAARQMLDEAAEEQALYQRGLDAQSLLARVMLQPAPHEVPCPFCATAGVAWHARLQQINEMVALRKNNAEASAYNAEVKRQEAQSIVDAGQALVAQAEQRLATAKHDRAKLKVSAQSIKANIDALQAALGDVADYEGQTSAEIEAQIAQLRNAEASRINLERMETDVRVLRRRAETAKTLKTEAKKAMTAALRRTKKKAEEAVNRYMPAGFTAQLTLSDKACEWRTVGDDERPHSRHTMCGSEKSSIIVALALAWTEDAPTRVLLLDDEDLAMLEPDNLQLMLQQVEAHVADGTVDQVFAAWPAARIDHVDDIPESWNVIRVGG